MRLWTIHPKYLDPQGLAALWREGLLARAVILGRTKGYRRHPQLDRFLAQRDPRAAIGAYLAAVAAEAEARGYSFDGKKIGRRRRAAPIEAMRGQAAYEWRHLLKKLKARAPGRWRDLRGLRAPSAHPLFRIVAGGIEPWERGALGSRKKRKASSLSAERIELRDVVEADLPRLYAFQADRVASRMAGFVPKKKAAFMAHWAKILQAPSIKKMALVVHGDVVGYFVCFKRSRKDEAGYWIARKHWGKGLAARGFKAFLKRVTKRPLYARVAKHNAASLAVAKKCGFAVVSEGSFKNNAGKKISEFVLKLGRRRI